MKKVSSTNSKSAIIQKSLSWSRKLLTGFDAPNNTILYLCRSLKEHTLLQAIARVNRVYPGKDYGYIIDYYGNLENLDSALSTYSGLEGFEEADLEGTLTRISVELEKLPQIHAELWDIFKEIKDKPIEPTVYEEFLEPEDKRNDFYEKLSQFSRLYKMGLSSVEFVSNTSEDKMKRYKWDAIFFLKLRTSVMRRYNDDLAYKEYEPQIQKLINKHISTEGEIKKITELVNIFDKEEREAEVEKIVGTAAQADHIASRTAKAINLKMEEDPIYYKKLADLIKETIEAYHQKRIDEAEFLQRAKGFEEKFLSKDREDAPPELVNNRPALTFYDLSKDVFEDKALVKTKFHVELGLALDTSIRETIHLNDKKIIEWQRNEDVRGKLNIALSDSVYDLLVKYDVDIQWEKIDELIEKCMNIAFLKY